ncbi:alpha/beta fold hydrolase [Gloeobacter violaceus]|uniref:alpha/beta fold hydrolase n=1 Tax=Gloeobacter violaceus TaxID=33072 RepID=UPI0002DDEB8C|nr:alpha/beta fold hydrolase [Gloeobacter violaceus]
MAAPAQAERVEARCGRLGVYEDRAARSGRQIALHLAVLPATGRQVDSDPLFMLAGGPGQAATEAFVPLIKAFERVNRRRDIVLIDQRGTGRSNPLDCPIDPNTATPERALASAADCAKSLQANLKLYTTAIAADDLDAVRSALGYGRINLYGGSYGTRLALAYLRRHPERVRTAVLDGVNPPDTSLGETVAADAQRVLEIAFARCRADNACNKAFPSLGSKFKALLARLDREPLTVTVADPTSGLPRSVKLDRTVLALTIQSLSYAPETVSLLPLLIHTAHQSGDWRPLAAQLQLTVGNIGDQVSLGMRLSVLCAEDIPFISSKEAGRTYLGNAWVQALRETCSVWPRGAIPADFKRPVTSNVPVLLLSGEADPITPPRNAERARRTLPNALALVVPGAGHITAFRGCTPRIVADFLAAGRARGLDTACLKKNRALPFFVDPSGPEA